MPPKPIFRPPGWVDCDLRRSCNEWLSRQRSLARPASNRSARPKQGNSNNARRLKLIEIWEYLEHQLPNSSWSDETSVAHSRPGGRFCLACLGVVPVHLL